MTMQKIKAPCIVDYDCINKNCVDNVCTRKTRRRTLTRPRAPPKSKLNGPCIVNNDCINKNCVDNVCTRRYTSYFRRKTLIRRARAPKKLNGPCIVDYDCINKNCVDNVCTRKTQTKKIKKREEIESDYSIMIKFNPIKKSKKIQKIRKKIEMKLNTDINPSNYLGDISYDELTQTLFKDIKKYKFCDGVNYGFIKESLEFCDLMVILKDPISFKLVGFCTLMFKAKHVYLDVICTNPKTKGVGTEILNVLDKINKVLKIEYIKLESITSAMPFYLKKDFECDNVCKMERFKGIEKTPKKIK
jgi:hypothetical protein